MAAPPARCRAGAVTVRRAWYPGRVTEQARVAEMLAAQRADALERLARIGQELSGIIESASAGADDEHDAEGPTLAFEREHLAALASQARQRLGEVDAALARLAEGSYGRCVTCGEPIGAARLAARPVSATCIGCARQR